MCHGQKQKEKTKTPKLLGRFLINIKNAYAVRVRKELARTQVGLVAEEEMDTGQLQVQMRRSNAQRGPTMKVNTVWLLVVSVG